MCGMTGAPGQPTGATEPTVHESAGADGAEPTVHDIFVPGRLCLFGEHSDWAGGHCRSAPVT